MVSCNKCFFTTEILYYPERNAFGYKVKAVSADSTFTILVSPGTYSTSDEAFVSAISDAQRLRKNMALRSAKLRKREVYKYLEAANPEGAT